MYRVTVRQERQDASVDWYMMSPDADANVISYKEEIKGILESAGAVISIDISDDGLRWDTHVDVADEATANSVTAQLQTLRDSTHDGVAHFELPTMAQYNATNNITYTIITVGVI